jgi:hypothetical protein
MLNFPSKSRQSRKAIRINRRKQLKDAKKVARACKANLNEAISRIKKEWKQEDVENDAYNNIQMIFKKVLTPEIVNQVAEKTGFKKRKRKIQPIAFISILMMGCFNTSVDSLKIMCALLLKWFNISIKHQSLQHLINKQETYEFIKEIQTVVMKFEINRAIDKLKDKKDRLCIKVFNKVLLQDSTVISLPEIMWRVFRGCGGSASPAAVKIDVIFDVNQSNLIGMKCVAGRVPDGNARLSGNILNYVELEDLVIRDLGYFNIKQLSEIAKKNAYFISRLTKSINVYLNEFDEIPLNIIKYFEEKCIKDKKIDIEVYLGKTERVPFRLIGIKVPQEVIEARREQYKRSNGRSKEPSESLIEWNGYTLMITNIPKEKLSHNAILKLYKIRWQIELLFKNFKSNLKIDEINGKNKHRILCLLHIKILLVCIVMNLCSYAQTLVDKEVSFFQITCWLQKVGEFRIIFATGNIDRLLDELRQHISQLCKQHQRTEKSSLEDIQNQLKEENFEKIA